MADIAQQNVEIVGGAPARAVKHVSEVLDDCTALSKESAKKAHDRMEKLADAVFMVEGVKILKTLGA